MGAYLILQVDQAIVLLVDLKLTLLVKDVNIPLQVQPQIFGFFSTIIWAQILHYGR